MAEDPRFVSQEQCQRVHLEVGLKLTSIDTKINTLTLKAEETNMGIKDISEDVYGRTELGEQKGGLITLLRDNNKKLDQLSIEIKKNGNAGHKEKASSLARRDKLMIGVLSMVGGIVVALISKLL